MSIPILYMEDANKKKSLRVAVAIHILVLLIALWPILQDDPEQNIDKQFSVAIAFDNLGPSNSFKGQAAEGVQRKRNETVDRVKTAPVKKVANESKAKPIQQPKTPMPQPQIQTAPAESEIFDEAAEIEAVQKAQEKVNKVPQRRVETPSEPEVVKALESDDTPTEIEDVPSQVPAATTSPVSDSGNNSSSPSKKDGSGTGQGKKGSGAGKDKSGNDSTSGIGTGGAGEGAFDGSGKGVFGRYPVKRPSLSQLSLKNGRIAFKVCIDRSGRTTYVSVLKRGTTIRDKKSQKNAIDWMYNFIWEEDYNVAKEQCGKYTLILENNTR